MSRHILKGEVVKCSSDKTCSVLVKRIISHPLYGKKMYRSKKYLCHDQENLCREGDLVTIQESRPFSKRKKFEIIHGADKVVEEKE